MPIATPRQLYGSINFTLRGEELDHDPSVYETTFDPDRPRPQKTLVVPVNDLRPELARGGLSVDSQVKSRGWAVSTHESEWVDQIGTEAGIEKYLEESAELIKKELGATRVVTWNSTCRKADDRKEDFVPRQEEPEKGFVPTARIQPPAARAHVDQAPEWAKKVVEMATGEDPDTFKRSMIINIWRPLHGPVTNAPLGMLDFPTASADDFLLGMSNFGNGLRIAHSPGQKWYYVRHQMPNEIVYLMCYDSTTNVCAGHTAIEVGEQDRQGVDEALIKPRESIEVRMIAVWE
ncbi:hypothetical protein BCR39DRAFT_599510 [Naematelia encephala]|uniref:Methyltransferase n=1 Tax=Naematelia encephala TaxID=71784 RepID=A0A1Y2AYY8_9TREE|nr:hypothetical protein BCR39DRAFT_599510 [Naematelia encephala]